MNPQRVVLSYLKSAQDLDSLMLSIYASDLYDKEAGWKATAIIAFIAFLAGNADITKAVERKAINYINENKPQEAISTVVHNTKKDINELVAEFNKTPKNQPAPQVQQTHGKKPVIKYDPTDERPKTEDKKIVEFSDIIGKVKNQEIDTSWFMTVSSPYLVDEYKKISSKLTPEEKNIFYKKLLSLAKKYGQGDPWVKKIMGGSKEWEPMKW